MPVRCRARGRQGEYTAPELKDAGYGGTEMRAASFSADALKNAGYSGTELRIAGYVCSVVKEVAAHPFGPSPCPCAHTLPVPAAIVFAAFAVAMAGGLFCEKGARGGVHGVRGVRGGLVDRGAEECWVLCAGAEGGGQARCL